MSNATTKYLKDFFAEKGLDREQVFEVKATLGTVNYIPAGVVIDTILVAPAKEKEQIAGILRRLDFANADVMDFLRHLAGALAYDL